LKNYFGWKDKILFTPGPLITSRTVKQAALRDLGSRDKEFTALTADVRKRLLEIAQVGKGEYEAIPMQGSGTFGLESVLASVTPNNGKILVVTNGAYGRRIAKMAQMMKIETVINESAEYALPSLESVERDLRIHRDISLIAAVHCETSTGILNPIAEIGELAKKYKASYMVDAVTTFGAAEIDIQNWNIDYLVFDSGKCLEGIPGFSIIIAKKDTLLLTEGSARSLSLDLLDQWRNLEESGQFRFTPPVQALLAFHQALKELEEEGGVQARAARYKTNYEILITGMRRLGFLEYLFPNIRGYFVTSFLMPEHPNFSYQTFYEKLREKDQIIYSGKMSGWESFRIATMGRITPNDVKYLLYAMGEALKEMNVDLKNHHLTTWEK
jgi:2-aminoethylphosphonate-pyruvate transaminase